MSQVAGRQLEDRAALNRGFRQFALSVIEWYRQMPADGVGSVLGRRLLRSGTSVGAHQREAHRARTTPESISKLEMAAQELGESLYWLQLMAEAQLFHRTVLDPIASKAEQLPAILVSAVKSAKRRL